MRILVTGGAGFIGSHIVDRYILEGHDVAVVDDLSTGNKDFINPKSNFYQHKIQSPDLEHVFKSFKPEIINHHAAHIDLRRSVTHPLFDAETNILGVLNILHLAQQHKTRKIIFASTGGAIYGEPKKIPVSERTNPKPMSPYGIHKLTAEHYLRIWSNISGIEYTVLRYANVYGPRQNPKGEAGVVAIFCLALLQNRQPVIFGDGTKTRDYVFVGDIAEANVAALTKAVNKIMNIGRGIEISDHEVYTSIAKAMNCHLKPRYDTIRLGEVKRIALDARNAKKWLDWESKVSFKDGAARAADYYRQNKSLFL
jgi:UDP-glucose 4-epimerase